MKKRILIVTMLIFLTVIKSSGLSNKDLLEEQAIPLASSYEKIPTSSPIPEAIPELTSAPVTASPKIHTPETSSNPSLAPTPTLNHTNTSSTPSPTPTPTPTHVPTSTPVYTPNTASTPTPNPTPIPKITTPDSILLNPSPTLGPLVSILPTYDIDNLEAQNFRKDMIYIINKAEKASGISTIYGLFIIDLQTNYSYGVNENLTGIDEAENVPEGYFNSASVIKLFQGYIFCDMMRNGELDSEKKWNDKVTGRKFKLMPMIKSMISYSDNNYSNACLRIVDNKVSNTVLNRLGIKNSRLYGEMSGAIGYSEKNNMKRYGTTKRCARLTPFDTALILYNIFINKDSDFYMKELNEALLGNVYNSRIPVGVKRVSPKYRVAHKTGTNSGRGIYNDAGIVYAKTPFILVVFTQNTTEKSGNSFIRSIAEQITKYYDSKSHFAN